MAPKVWRQLKREGIEVARCTVEWLMKRLGLEGVRRGKVIKTTVPNKAIHCLLDCVNQQFWAERPNQLWVVDFTYVSTWQGWLYVVFVIDVFARRIVGWRVNPRMHTDFVLDALEQALYARQPELGGLIYHSGGGSQYVSIRLPSGLPRPWWNLLCAAGATVTTTPWPRLNGLYKSELIYKRGPWKNRESVELATLEWVSWFNHQRLLELIGYIPPAERILPTLLKLNSLHKIRGDSRHRLGNL